MSDKPQEYDGKCHATAKSTGKACGLRPAPGAVVCRYHGGNLPKVKNAAAFRVARDKKQKEALARLKAEGASKVDILEEMLRLAAEAIVWKDLCREAMEDLWALGEIRYKGQTGEQLRAEVAFFERMMDRCFNVLAGIEKLGIQQQKVEIEKAKAIIVAGAIRAILAQLELSPEQARVAPSIIQREMLAISAELGDE